MATQLELSEKSTKLLEEIKKFSDIIKNAGYASPVRKTRGQDIMAACGQLKSSSIKIRKSELRSNG